jgi:predicted RNase H-like nuclease (RuvC/YqgF family)
MVETRRSLKAKATSLNGKGTDVERLAPLLRIALEQKQSGVAELNEALLRFELAVDMNVRLAGQLYTVRKTCSRLRERLAQSEARVVELAEELEDKNDDSAFAMVIVSRQEQPEAKHDDQRLQQGVALEAPELASCSPP